MTVSPSTSRPISRGLSIPRGGFDLAAELYLPEEPDGQTRYPTVVVATPGSSVKEQIGATYARALAARGLAVLTFDPAYQGRSGGEPRDLEDPAERIADLRHAVDLLDRLDVVDPDRLGVLGICAGGGYAVSAAMSDHRLRAVGTVVPVNIGRARRQGAASRPGGVAAVLGEAAHAATVEARGGDAARIPWIPDSPEDAESAGVTDVDLLQAVTYYRTPRGRSPYSTNRRLARSDALMLAFDAFHLADELLTQPVAVVVAGAGGSTGSLEDGKQLAALAPNAEDLIVIEGARHYEMYDDLGYVEEAATHLSGFFTSHLGPPA